MPTENRWRGVQIGNTPNFGPGMWSNAAAWNLGHVPTSGEVAVFTLTSSEAACTIDVLPTVSIEIRSDFPSTITVQDFSLTFTNFHLGGSATFNAGNGNFSCQTLTLDSGARLNGGLGDWNIGTTCSIDSSAVVNWTQGKLILAGSNTTDTVDLGNQSLPPIFFGPSAVTARLLPSGSEPTWTTPGHDGAGHSLQFSQSLQNYVESTDVPTVGPNSISISLWFKQSGSETYPAILFTDVPIFVVASLPSVLNNGADLFLTSDTQIRVQSAYANTGFGAGTTIPSLGTSWHHVAGVIDYGLGDAYLYLDGNLIEHTQVQGQAPLRNTNVIPFIHLSDPSTGFNGQIDEVKVFGVPLTSGDVASLYSTGTSVAVPLAHYGLDEGSGTLTRNAPVGDKRYVGATSVTGVTTSTISVGVNSTLTIDNPHVLVINGASVSVKSGATLTGTGELDLTGGASVVQQDGTWSVPLVVFQGTSQVVAATYSTDITIGNAGTLVSGSGSMRITGSLAQNVSSTVNNSVNNPNLQIDGAVTISGDYIPGTGTLTLGVKSGTQIFNPGTGNTFERIVINQSGASKQLASGTTLNCAGFNFSNGTFDYNGGTVISQNATVDPSWTYPATLVLGGSTTNILGNGFVMQGVSGTQLHLNPSTVWNLTVSGTPTAHHVLARNSNAAMGMTVDASDGTNDVDVSDINWRTVAAPVAPTPPSSGPQVYITEPGSPRIPQFSADHPLTFPLIEQVITVVTGLAPAVVTGQVTAGSQAGPVMTGVDPTTVNVIIEKDGIGPFTIPAGTVYEIGSGQYGTTANVSDVNTLGEIKLRAWTSGSCISLATYDVFDPQESGLTAEEVRLEMDANSVRLASIETKATEIAADTDQILADLATDSSSILSAVGSPLQAGAYTAPDNAGIAEANADLDEIIAELPDIASDLDEVLAKLSLFQAGQPLLWTFPMTVPSLEGVDSPGVGLSVTVTRIVDGAAEQPCDNLPSEVGHGSYNIMLTTNDLPLTAKEVFFRAKATGANDQTWTIFLSVP